MFTKFGIFAADTHLARRAWNKQPELCGDAYHSFLQLVTLSAQLAVPLFLAGDIFDKKNLDSETALKFTEAVVGTPYPIYVIQGDHDITEPPWTDLARCVTHIDKQMVNAGGVKIYGLDFRRRGELQEELAKVPTDADILLCHQGWSDIRGIGSTEGDFADIQFVKHVVTGDYHKHGVWQGRGTQGQEVTAYSPGSTCMQSVDENPEKFVYVAGVDENHNISMESVQLTTRPFHTITIGSEEEATAALAWLAKVATEGHAVGKPAVRVKYGQHIPEMASRIKQAAGDNWFVFEEPQAGINIEKAADLATLDLGDGHAQVASAFQQYMSAESAEFANLSLLWRTDEAELRDQLGRIKESFFSE